MVRPGQMMAALLMAAGLGSAASAEERQAPCAFDDRIERGIAYFEDCGWIETGGRPHVKAEYWKRFRFDAHGLSAARIGERWFWFARDGRWAETMLVDTWAEDFRNGRARSPRSGKIGYIDRSLRLVIPARYDGALPFDGGVAEVCNGCSLVQHGEHWIYEGGTWSCVDARGRERLRNGANC